MKIGVLCLGRRYLVFILFVVDDVLNLGRKRWLIYFGGYLRVIILSVELTLSVDNLLDAGGLSARQRRFENGSPRETRRRLISTRSIKLDTRAVGLINHM